MVYVEPSSSSSFVLLLLLLPVPRTQKSVPRSLTGGLAQQPSRVARLLALLCTLLQPLSHRSQG